MNGAFNIQPRYQPAGVWEARRGTLKLTLPPRQAAASFA